MKLFTIFVMSMLFCGILRAQDETSDGKSFLYQKDMLRYRSAKMQSPLDDRFDVGYYKLDIRIFTSPSPNYLKGVVTMTAASRQSNLTAISLDLMNSLTVDSVEMGGVKVPFTQFTEYFNITLDRAYNQNELMTLKVYYQGIPGSSGFGSFIFATHGSGTPFVWTLSEPYGAKDWWPCKDHPMDKADSVDIHVTVDTAYKVGSNGKLVGIIDNGNGTKTYRWHEKYPIATYLVSITFSDFAEFTNWWYYSANDSMPILNYVLPEHKSAAQTQFALVPQMLTIFSSIFGMYPFVDEKYGHCEFGWGGAMEHQTMTSITYSFGEFTTAHELAHQWFGDLITCRTWPDLWLNEGFATYSEALYREAKYGSASYWLKMNNAMTNAKNASGTLFVQDTSNVNNLFDGSRVYNKGASVLHMLRHVLGDTVFFHAMKNYASTPSLRFSTASTDDFKNVCEATSGKDLDYFFNQWVFGTRYPQYQWWWRTKAATGGGYNVTMGVQQTTGTSNPVYFAMPIDFKIKAAGWDTTFIAFNNQPSQTFTVRVSRQPTSVLFDSAGWILKTATQITAPADTSSTDTTSTDTTSVLPTKVVLEQNYPNPFNPSTRIKYALPAPGAVSLKIYNIIGQEIRTLESGVKTEGNHVSVWDGTDNSGRVVPSGIYLYRLKIGKDIRTKKMIFLK